jgi:hypothetical protein
VEDELHSLKRRVLQLFVERIDVARGNSVLSLEFIEPQSLSK